MPCLTFPFILCLMSYLCSPKKECRKIVLFWCKVETWHIASSMHHISLYVVSYALCVRRQKKGVRDDCFVSLQGCKVTHLKFHGSHFLLFSKKGEQDDCFASVQGRQVVYAMRHASHFPLCYGLCLMCAAPKKECRNIVLFRCKVKSARMSHHISLYVMCYDVLCVRPKKREGKTKYCFVLVQGSKCKVGTSHFPYCYLSCLMCAAQKKEGREIILVQCIQCHVVDMTLDASKISCWMYRNNIPFCGSR